VNGLYTPLTHPTTIAAKVTEIPKSKVHLMNLRFLKYLLNFLTKEEQRCHVNQQHFVLSEPKENKMTASTLFLPLVSWHLQVQLEYIPLSKMRTSVLHCHAVKHTFN